MFFLCFLFVLFFLFLLLLFFLLFFLLVVPLVFFSSFFTSSSSRLPRNLLHRSCLRLSCPCLLRVVLLPLRPIRLRVLLLPRRRLFLLPLRRLCRPCFRLRGPRLLLLRILRVNGWGMGKRGSKVSKRPIPEARLRSTETNPTDKKKKEGTNVG